MEAPTSADSSRQTSLFRLEDSERQVKEGQERVEASRALGGLPEFFRNLSKPKFWMDDLVQETAKTLPLYHQWELRLGPSGRPTLWL